MPTLPGLRVVRSKIHGYGVVATRPFSEGELIADVDGVVLTREELEDDEYCLWVNDDLYFDMVDQTRWINHSCDPNAEVEAEELGEGRVAARITAFRDIKEGEEITYDYAFAIEHACPCACGSPVCRRWIVDEDVLADLPMQSFAADRAPREQSAPPAEPPATARDRSS